MSSTDSPLQETPRDADKRDAEQPQAVLRLHDAVPLAGKVDDEPVAEVAGV